MAGQLAFPFVRVGRSIRTRPPRLRKKTTFSDLYRWYVNSPQWEEKRQEAFQALGRSCERCGTDDGPINVHHKNYLRLGYEDVYKDLAILCEPCHQYVHDVKEWADAY